MEIRTLDQRADEFWGWFASNEKTLSRMATQRGDFEMEEVVSFVSEGVALLGEEIHFNIGGDHEFTFAVSGHDHLFYLLPYVVARAPKDLREKWQFFPSMQGTGGQSFGLEMHGARVNADDVLVGVALNQEEKSADLRFYAEGWKQLPDNQCYSAFFIMLENIIGEGLSYTAVDGVDRAQGPEAGMIPLTQLEALLRDAFEEQGVPDPSNRHFSYRAEPQENDAPRQDIFIGTGCYARLINNYYGDSRESYDALMACGAQPLYLFYFYDSEGDSKAALDERYDLMDRLEAEALGQRGSGQEAGLLLGGAMGVRRAYIDLLVFDPIAFWPKARRILAEYPHFFFMADFVNGSEVIPITDHRTPGFLDRLELLHQREGHQEILWAIGAVAKSEWDYQLKSLYARALNNLSREAEALDLLLAIRADGEQDPLWHFRVGYSLFYTDREAEAIPYLQQAIALGDNTATAALLLGLSYYYEDQYREAAQWLRKAIDLGENDPQAEKYLESALALME